MSLLHLALGFGEGSMRWVRYDVYTRLEPNLTLSPRLMARVRVWSRVRAGIPKLAIGVLPYPTTSMVRNGSTNTLVPD